MPKTKHETYNPEFYELRQHMIDSFSVDVAMSTDRIDRIVEITIRSGHNGMVNAIPSMRCLVDVRDAINEFLKENK